ncbi:augmin complex subunit msd5 [Drosophila tropicalis]|uniref:augmin complex subunit msd5 n=1 Tax=Drosophila tropicalis TaxID=46794 RepID=UPI0035ABBEB4
MDTKDISSVNFSQFSEKVYEEFGKDAKNTLRDLCVIKSVIKPKQFFDFLQKQWQELSPSEMSLSSCSLEDTELSLLADYAELCKSFEEYPTNLRKLPPPKKLQRANSTMLKGVSCDLEPDQYMHHQSTSVDATRLDMQRGAKQLYKDYHQFHEKLKNVGDQAAARNDDEKVYQEKIKQTQGFAQQLDKLIPKEERQCSDAFTANEAEKLKAIADSLEQLNYLRSHENVRLLHETFSNDLEALVDIVSNTLIQISCL